MEDKPTMQTGNNLDVRNYLLKIIAYWYLFLIVFVIGFIFKYIYERFTTYTYSSNATLILYDDLQNTQAALNTLKIFDNRKDYETEFGVLKSYSLNKIALSELDFDISYFKHESFKSDIDLYKNSPFVVKLDSSKPQANNIKYYLEFISDSKIRIEEDETGRVSELNFGQLYSTDNQSFIIEKNNRINFDYSELKGNKYYFYKNDFNTLVLDYKDRLNVDLRSPNSSILWLWISGTVPERIVDYLNKLSEVYMRQKLESKNRIVLNTIKFIDVQLKNIVDSLGQSENKLKNLESSSNFLDINKQDELIVKELESLQEANKLSGIKKSFYEYLENNLDKDAASINIVSPYLVDIQDFVMEGLLQEYQKTQSEKEVLQYDVKKDIPQMDIFNLKLQQLKVRLKKHIKNSKQAIDYNIQQGNSKIKKLYNQLRNSPKSQRQIANIKRKYELNDNIYTFLLEKRTEAGITMASNSPGAKVLDMAISQNAVCDNPNTNGTIKTILICLVISILIIEIKGFFNNKIIDRADIEKQTSIPILSSISHNTTASDLPIYDFPKNPVSESFRLLKTNLQYLLVDKQNPVISVNSTISGEGKTFCSSNLSILFAMLGKKVLLIGLDLRKPRIHIPFNNNNNVGLSTYLIGSNNLDEVIFDTQVDNLSLLPAGPVPPNPAELIESPKMSELITSLKKIYDYIIIDTAPIAHVADTLLISKFTDANIFVIRQNYSNKNLIKAIDELYVNKKINNMGLLINDVNPSMIFGLKYGYGFSYGYSYGYGYGQKAAYYDNDVHKSSFIKRIGSNLYGLIEKLFN